MDRQFTGVDGQFTGVDKSPFSQNVPWTARLEREDDNEVPPPLVRILVKVDNGSSDEKDNAEDRIVVEDVED